MNLVKLSSSRRVDVVSYNNATGIARDNLAKKKVLAHFDEGG